MQDKPLVIRFAKKCREIDRQYEFNNNGKLDNGVYHKFVYSTKDSKGAKEDKKRQAENLLSRNSSHNLLNQNSVSSEDLTKAKDPKKKKKKEVDEKRQSQAERDALKADILKMMGKETVKRQGSE